MKRIERHIKIVTFLNSLPDSEGGKAFKLQLHKKMRNRGEFNKAINTHDTFDMVKVLCETFAIESGSAGDVDFYRLLQAYLLDETKRNQINNII